MKIIFTQILTFPPTLFLYGKLFIDEQPEKYRAGPTSVQISG